MRTRAIVASELEAKHREQVALLGKPEAELTAADLDAAEALGAECAALETELAGFARLGALAQTAQARQGFLETPVQNHPLPGAAPLALAAGGLPALPTGGAVGGLLAGPAPSPGYLQGPQVPAGTIPAEVRRVRLENINRCKWLKEAQIDPQLHAYQFGMWLGATLFRVPRCLQYCREQGLALQWVHGTANQPMMGADTQQFAQAESVNVAGGYLVVPQFDNTLIDLREIYGAFRRFARIEPMTSDVKWIPRRTGGVTAYFPGEGGAITPSQAAFDQVQLVAKKPAVLVYYSNELSEDAIISIADRLALEIAYAFAVKEDQCGFNGDGTSTYGGIVGICPKFLGLSATRANIAGLVVGSGNQWSELKLTDFTTLQGKLPLYARQDPSVAWYVSVPFYEGVMKALALAAGGVTAAEVANTGGAPEPRFLGAPVRFAQAMPLAEANDQVCALYGALPLGVAFGDRRQTTIAMSDQYAFNTDQIAIRGTERFDVNVHDIGNADATAGNRVPGPLVGLLTAAS